MTYESLLKEAMHHGIDIYEKPMHYKIKGLYADDVIWINRNQTKTEKACILAEELGHYHTTAGNIIDQSKIANRKQELRARQWAYYYLIPLSKIVQALRKGICSRYELADYLGVTEDFLDDALKRYQKKYGTHIKIDGYTLRFNPLGIMELFD